MYGQYMLDFVKGWGIELENTPLKRKPLRCYLPFGHKTHRYSGPSANVLTICQNCGETKVGIYADSWLDGTNWDLKTVGYTDSKPLMQKLESSSDIVRLRTFGDRKP